MAIALFAVSTIVTLLVCLGATKIGETLGVMDVPDAKRKRHARATPLVGGLAIVTPLIFVSLYYGHKTEMPIFNAYAVVLAGALLLGFRDDRRHLPALFRLAISAVVGLAGLVMFSSFELKFLHFSFMEVPIFTYGWGLPFTILCLVGLQNAINMADGKNGLVIGLCAIWTALLMIYAPPSLYPLLATLLGGLIVTLFFNIKGRLFLGDAGAYALSFGIALLALYIYDINFVALSADMVALWFLVPVVDCLRLMVSRSLAGRSPFSADRCHLHHILLRFMVWDKALIVYLTLVFVPSFLAVWQPDLTLLWGALALTAYVSVVGSARVLQLEREVGARS